MTRAPSEDSDQPGRLSSLSGLHCPSDEGLGSWLPKKRTAKTDQTGWMPRLISGRTGHFDFVVHRLI